jgi:hypothetical protein
MPSLVVMALVDVNTTTSSSQLVLELSMVLLIRVMRNAGICLDMTSLENVLRLRSSTLVCCICEMEISVDLLIIYSTTILRKS